MPAITPQRMNILSVNGVTQTTDLFQEMGPWLPSVGVSDVRGVLVLCERTQNFRVRLALQRADTDVEVVTVTLNPSNAANVGTGYLQAVGKQFFQFDPTLASNGVINTGAFWRLGVLFSESAAGNVGRGDVLLRAGYKLC